MKNVYQASHVCRSDFFWKIVRRERAFASWFEVQCTQILSDLDGRQNNFLSCGTASLACSLNHWDTMHPFVEKRNLSTCNWPGYLWLVCLAPWQPPRLSPANHQQWGEVWLVCPQQRSGHWMPYIRYWTYLLDSNASERAYTLLCQLRTRCRHALSPSVRCFSLAVSFRGV